MKRLERNQLVWINPGAWQQFEARTWDLEAQEILAYWRINNFPLVVSRQGSATIPDQISVGLPAPGQWSRRRLALSLPLEQITVSGNFPEFSQVARSNQWGTLAVNLGLALSALGVHTRVYGSHGWQFLTDLTYLHDESDIDLSLHVDNFEMACQVVELLSRTQLHRWIDGEIVFPSGEAIAWRELQNLLAGKTKQVLVKARCNIRLAVMEQVCQFGREVEIIASNTTLLELISL